MIVASDTTAGKAVVMSALDGSGLAFVTCAGDLTHGGARPPLFPPLGWRTTLRLRRELRRRDAVTTDTSLVRNVPRWSLSVPSWSADNHRIVYALIVGGQSDLFVGDVDSGTATNVTSSATNEYTPALSPVANQIAYVRQTSKGGVYRNDIFVLDLGTRKTM